MTTGSEAVPASERSRRSDLEPAQPRHGAVRSASTRPLGGAVVADAPPGRPQPSSAVICRAHASRELTTPRPDCTAAPRGAVVVDDPGDALPAVKSGRLLLGLAGRRAAGNRHEDRSLARRAGGSASGAAQHLGPGQAGEVSARDGAALTRALHRVLDLPRTPRRCGSGLAARSRCRCREPEMATTFCRRRRDARTRISPRSVNFERVREEVAQDLRDLAPRRCRAAGRRPAPRRPARTRRSTRSGRSMPRRRAEEMRERRTRDRADDDLARLDLRQVQRGRPPAPSGRAPPSRMKPTCLLLLRGQSSPSARFEAATATWPGSSSAGVRNSWLMFERNRVFISSARCR